MEVICEYEAYGGVVKYDLIFKSESLEECENILELLQCDIKQPNCYIRINEPKYKTFQEALDELEDLW